MSIISKSRETAVILLVMIESYRDKFTVMTKCSSQVALLRFIKNVSDKPEVAILVIMSENIVRNVNQDSRFIYGPKLMLRPQLTLPQRC